MPRSLSQLTALTYALAVSYQAEQDIPPFDPQIIMSEVWTSIMFYSVLSFCLSAILIDDSLPSLCFFLWWCVQAPLRTVEPFF